MTAFKNCAKILTFIRKLRMRNTDTMLPKTERRAEGAAKETNSSAAPNLAHPKLFWLACAVAFLAAFGACANHSHDFREKQTPAFTLTGAASKPLTVRTIPESDYAELD
jgi:hypothetical protein